MKYILRTILKDKEKTLTDNFYIIESFNKLLEKVDKIDPDHYQCFEINDITNNFYLHLEKYKSEKKIKEKRKLYEELKLEFEN